MSQPNAPSAPPIAFLFPAFPVLHQTFVLWEVLALRRLGVAIKLYSIKRPSTQTQQPEGAALAQEVVYLPGTLSGAVLKSNWQAARRDVRGYCAAYARLIREWWRDRHVGRQWQKRRIAPDAPEQYFTLREVLSGRFNRNALLYLLKSLWLVPQAVHLGHALQRAGIRRVHAHWASYPATMAMVMHWVYGIPYSFTAHAYDIYMVPLLLRPKVNEAEFVVTCAQVNARYLAAMAGSEHSPRIIVNYHGVSLERFRPRPAAAAGRERCLVTCGRLEPYKGHHILLQACARMQPPPRCIVIGEGPQRQRLEQLAAELGIGASVEFTGPLPQAKLVEIYRRADLFVLASVVLERSGKRDVIPNVLAEAMAMEVPVVATDVSGISELVTDGVSGRLVPPNDPAALAAALEELLDDPVARERLGQAGARTVAAMFDRSVNIQDLATLFLAPPEQAPGSPPPSADVA